MDYDINLIGDKDLDNLSLFIYNIIKILIDDICLEIKNQKNSMMKINDK